MSATTVTLAVKAGAAALKDKRTWTVLGSIVCAIFMPIILILFVILSIGDGAAQHNRAAVQASFDSGIPLSAKALPGYNSRIQEIRECFSALDAAIGTLNAENEDGQTLDAIRIKSMYFSKYFDQTPSLDTATALLFAKCFVQEEERTRIVTEWQTPEATEDNPKPKPVKVEVEETYTVTVPVTSLQTQFANVAAHTGGGMSLEQQSACMEIEYIIKYGSAAFSDTGDDLVALLIDMNSDYIGGDFASPFSDGWRSKVTSEYGMRIHPITGKQDGHRGIDLAAPAGTPIRAVANGAVALARYGHPSYGNYLVIDHGGGVTTLYAHCKSLAVGVGQSVSAGDTIAFVGSTGDSTGNHLHLEVKVGGALTNPRNILP